MVTYRRLTVRVARWPIRRRLAAVSASMTFVILIAFAAVIGQLASSTLRNDFRDELLSVANRLAVNVAVGRNVEDTPIRGPSLDEMALAGHAAARIVTGDGRVVQILTPEGPTLAQTSGAPDLGAPTTDSITEIGQFDVVAQDVTPPGTLGGSLYFQYARSREQLESTTRRLWLLLGGGVLGGTLLAWLAGLAVARRAMTPIADLTEAAQRIALTRDPSERLPRLARQDEIAELSATLERMLGELDNARRESEQLVESQRSFIADASHELRTPLTSVLANLELLHAELQSAGDSSHVAEQREIVQAAVESSRRMSRLVTDLITLAKAEAGTSHAREQCRLGEIVEDAAREVRAITPGRSIQVEAVDSGRVSGSRDLLHRVATNLISNGVRHTPDGTTVWARVMREGSHVVLEVADDGPGIPPEVVGRVFERFSQGASSADVSGRAGMGLGLAIVKSIATAHGGEVAVDRAPEGGARFIVRLPAEMGQATHMQRVA